MAVITLHPKLGFSEDNQNVETPVKLGDGYLMPGRVKGSDRKTYSITGVLQSLEEMELVVSQFEELAGVKFQWSPIPELAYLAWWCPSFDVTYMGRDSQGDKWEVSAKFEEAR